MPYKKTINGSISDSVFFTNLSSDDYMILSSYSENKSLVCSHFIAVSNKTWRVKVTDAIGNPVEDINDMQITLILMNNL